MGMTLLCMCQDEERVGAAVLYFKARNYGADGWRDIVDDLAPLGDRIAARAGVAMERLDPPYISAGRGARYRLPLKLAVLLAALVEQRHRDAVAVGELVVIPGDVPEEMLDAARRVAARRASVAGVR